MSLHREDLKLADDLDALGEHDAAAQLRACRSHEAFEQVRMALLVRMARSEDFMHERSPVSDCENCAHLTRERDTYREALERIVGLALDDSHLSQELARQALGPTTAGCGCGVQLVPTRERR